MNTNILISTSVLAISFFQGIMQISALLKAKECNRKANIVMASLIFICILLSFDCYLHFTNSINRYPHLVRVFTPLYILMGVLTYMYSRMLTEKEFHKTKKCLLHLIPFFIIIILSIPTYLLTAEEKIRYVVESQDFISRKIIMLFIMLSNTFYLVTGYMKLRNYQRKIQDFYSNISVIEIRWVKHLYVAFLIVHFSVVFLSMIYTNQNFTIVYQLIFYGLFIIISVSGYLAIRQTDPLIHLIKLKDKKKESSINKDVLSEKLKTEVKNELEKALIQKKIFLDSNLNLDSLSKGIGFPGYIVSMVINSAFNMTFFELINSLRIKEACIRLKDKEYENLKIIAIAEDVGFNSKSSFNSEFKKRMNTTPSQYRSMNS